MITDQLYNTSNYMLKLNDDLTFFFQIKELIKEYFIL